MLAMDAIIRKKIAEIRNSCQDILIQPPLKKVIAY